MTINDGYNHELYTPTPHLYHFNSALVPADDHLEITGQSSPAAVAMVEHLEDVLADIEDGPQAQRLTLVLSLTRKDIHNRTCDLAVEHGTVSVHRAVVAHVVVTIVLRTVSVHLGGVVLRAVRLHTRVAGSLRFVEAASRTVESLVAVEVLETVLAVLLVEVLETVLPVELMEAMFAVTLPIVHRAVLVVVSIVRLVVTSNQLRQVSALLVVVARTVANNIGNTLDAIAEEAPKAEGLAAFLTSRRSCTSDEIVQFAPVVGDLVGHRYWHSRSRQDESNEG